MTDFEVKTPRFLNGNQLKWIAIVCMLIDHIAWTFVQLDSPLGIIMHFIGRVTGPTMFFFIAEGYFHTRNVKRYALRLFIFGIISWIPFSLFDAGTLFSDNLGVIWTLFLGLMALWACDKLNNPLFKIIIVLGCCFLSSFGDWAIYGVLYVVALGLTSSFKKQCIWFSAITVLMIIPTVIQIAMVMSNEAYEDYVVKGIALVLINLGCFLPLFLLKFYNGKRGGEKYKGINKWAFYIFYPAHLLILWAIKLVLQ